MRIATNKQECKSITTWLCKGTGNLARIYLFCKRLLQCCESSVSIGSVRLQGLHSLLQAAQLLLLVPQLLLQVLNLQFKHK